MLWPQKYPPPPVATRPVIDFIVFENGNSKETEIHVCAADVGSTAHCNRRELSRINEVGNCTDGV